jgi:hypothetical protein
MVRVSQPWHNKRFVQYDKTVEKKGKQVTKKPVFFGLINGIPSGNTTQSRKIDRNAAATVIRRKNPTEYQVVMKDSYFYRNQNNPTKDNKILAHEVAHIAYNSHGPAWQRVAKKLGAGEYATARGTLK